MPLHISKLQYQRIQEALEAAYPQEGCGVLVGRRVFEARAVDASLAPLSPSPPQEIYRQVVQVIPVANAWEPGLLGEVDGGADVNNGDLPQPPSNHGVHDRYWIDPADLLRIQKQARDQGLEILGIAHSHPDHPAVPSECDRRLAWPVYSYLIASVRQGQVVAMQSWRLNATQRFDPEDIDLRG